MKKLISILVCITAVIVFGSASAMAESLLLEYDGDVHEYTGEVYSLVVNNTEINPPLSPIIFNDRALVPVREIFEEVGATVEYDGSDQSITIYNDNTTVILYINDNIAYINGKKTAIPDNVVPKLISKLGGETKTMVPVRFISESIGMPVDFDAEDGAILIASDNFDSSTLHKNQSREEASATPSPVATPAAKSEISGITYSASGDTLNITLTANGRPESVADFKMSNPGRLVVDFYGMAMNAATDTLYINQIGVTSLRFGDNGERARMVVDSEYVASYSVNVVSDTEIKVSVKTSADAKKNENTVVVTTPVPQTADSSQSTQVSGPANRVVMLDAGHGGSDSGAVGKLGGETILEKTLTLQITYKVKEILENNGIATSLTRTGDTLPSLVERPTQANAENVALFVSIHINSVDNAPTASGIETFYSLENNGDAYGTTSEKLATALLKNMVSATGAVNRGVKTANHAVTRRCNMPASLVECGFITNDSEVSNMCSDDYQYKLAQGIAQGIIDTLPYVNTK